MNTKPDFLAIGALVRVSGFVGVIAEIAESGNSILVKVESAKAARRFQKPDWLNYTDAPQLWAPATWQDFLDDAEGEKTAALRSVEAIDRYVEKVKAVWEPAMVETTDAPARARLEKAPVLP